MKTMNNPEINKNEPSQNDQLKVKCILCGNKIEMVKIDEHSLGCSIKQPAIAKMNPGKKNSGKEKKGFFRILFRGKPKNSGKSREKEEKTELHEISAPIKFKHETHIGWDPTNGFDITNIPPEWKVLFKKAGVKKKELKDKDTASFVMKTVVQNLTNDEENQQIGQISAISLYKFEPQTDSEVSANKGDQLTILDNSDENWWYVLNHSNDMMGYLPASYIHLVSSESSSHSEFSHSLFGSDPLHPYSTKKGYPLPKISSQSKEIPLSNLPQKKDQLEVEEVDSYEDEDEEEGSEYDEKEIQTKIEEEQKEREDRNDSDQLNQKVEVTIKEEINTVVVNDQLSIQSVDNSIVVETRNEDSGVPSNENREHKLPSNLMDLILKKKTHLKPVMEKKLSLPKLGQSTDGLALILATALKNRRISSLEGSNSSLKESDSSSDDEWSD